MHNLIIWLVWITSSFTNRETIMVVVKGEKCAAYNDTSSNSTSFSQLRRTDSNFQELQLGTVGSSYGVLPSIPVDAVSHVAHNYRGVRSKKINFFNTVPSVAPLKTPYSQESIRKGEVLVGTDVLSPEPRNFQEVEKKEVTILGRYPSRESRGPIRAPRRTPHFEAISKKASGKRQSLRLRKSPQFQEVRTQKNPLPASYAHDIRQGSLLNAVLSSIVSRELGQCLLMIALDAFFKDSSILDTLVLMPHFRKVTKVKDHSDFTSLMTKSSKCRAYIFLMEDPKTLLSYTNATDGIWDYFGKYIFVGLSLEDLRNLAISEIGKKTEHILGIVQDDVEECKVYMNQLFWGDGTMVLVNRWRKQGFTSGAELFPDKTWDLRGAPLTFITFEFEPHVIYGKDSRHGGHEYHGRDIQIAHVLSSALNFSLEIREPLDGEYWGYKDETGAWNGMTGELAKNEGHFGLAFFFLTDNDNMTEVLDYSRFYDSDTSCFMARTEPPLPLWQSLAAPFKLETWLAVLVGLLAVSPVLYIFARASATFEMENKKLLNLSESYLYSWGMYFREPQPSLPEGASTQVWIIFFWLYVIVLTTSYSCNLTAFLTVERPGASMDTIRELYASPLDVVTVGYFFKVSLEESGNIYLQGLASRYKGLSSYQESYNSLQKGKAVLLETRTYLEYLIATDFTVNGKPTMRILKECYAPYSIAIALQKNFPLKRSFDKVLGWLYDAGMLRQWFLDLLRTTSASKTSSKEKANVTDGSSLEAEGGGGATEDGGGAIALSINHLQGIFYIHLGGLLISTVLFFSEIFFLERCKSPRE